MAFSNGCSGQPTNKYYGNTDLGFALKYPQTLLTMSPKVRDNSKRDSRWPTDHHRSVKMYQTYRGQVNISVQTAPTSGKETVLKVYITQAKDIPSSNNTADGAYFVRVSIIVGKSTQPEISYRSALLKGGSCHDDLMFKQQFCFDLHHKKWYRENRRLLISLHYTDDENNFKQDDNVLIGCFSFQVKNLLRTTPTGGAATSGWFYLLTEELGNSKHMRVVEGEMDEQHSDDCNEQYEKDGEERVMLLKPMKSMETYTRTSQTFTMDTGYFKGHNLENQMENVDFNTRIHPQMEAVRVILFKTISKRGPINVADGSPSYGFTLTDRGHQPNMSQVKPRSLTECDHQPTVSQVKPRSVADYGGLREGDLLYKVNGHSVCGMPSYQVGKIIRHCYRAVVLDVMRPKC